MPRICRRIGNGFRLLWAAKPEIMEMMPKMASFRVKTALFFLPFGGIFINNCVNCYLAIWFSG